MATPHERRESPSVVKRISIPLFCLLASLPPVPVQGQAPSLADEDRTRLAEMFALAADVEDCAWPGWSSVPFAVLLVAGEHEYLVRHPAPSDEFISIGYDSLLQSAVYARERVFAPDLLATFPAVGGIPTVVIGQPEFTGKSSTLWVLTALHEHFHQLQYSRPGYYEALNALDLSGGDETGMWILTYPLPYEDAEVARHIYEYRDALQQALAAAYSPFADSAFLQLARARVRLSDKLGEKDDRYLSFQLWQEGVARYTESRVAQLAVGRHTPLPRFEQLEDFMTYAEAADSLRRLLAEELEQLDVGSWKRAVVYPLGAAQALVLDLMQPGWRRTYFEKKFSLRPR